MINLEKLSELEVSELSIPKTVSKGLTKSVNQATANRIYLCLQANNLAKYSNQKLYDSASGGIKEYFSEIFKVNEGEVTIKKRTLYDISDGSVTEIEVGQTVTTKNGKTAKISGVDCTNSNLFLCYKEGKEIQKLKVVRPKIVLNSGEKVQLNDLELKFKPGDKIEASKKIDFLHFKNTGKKENETGFITKISE